jgi:hypothetical protein
MMARETVSCYRAPRKQTPIKFSVQSFSELKKNCDCLQKRDMTQSFSTVTAREILYRRRGLVYLRLLNFVHFLRDGHDCCRMRRSVRLSTRFFYETTKWIYIKFVIGELHTCCYYKNLILINKVKKVRLPL